MQLDGSTALITGAGSGIGRALAQELSRRGVRVILLGRNLAALEQTRAMIADPDASAVVVMDLVERSAIAAQIGALTDRLDLLVNNAGVVISGLIEEQTDEAWRAMIEVDLLAPMGVTRDLLPLLRKSGQGRVVNIGSMFGDIAFPYFAAYSAAKFGLRGWSDGLRRELADQGIGVTYCAPRGTDTPAAKGFSDYVAAFAMKLDSPEKAARRIVDAVSRDARDVYPRGPERFFLLMQRLLPGMVDSGLADQMRKAKEKLVRKRSA